MAEREEIWVLAVHYSRLQGLRAVPPGLILLLVTLWANFASGPSRNILIPIIISILGALLYELIDHYNKNSFGQTRPKKGDRVKDILIQFLVGVLALVPDSLVELVFVALFTYGYLKTARSGKPSRLYPLVLAGLITLVRLSPLFGMGPWWQVLGMREQMEGVLVLISAIGLFWGILDHLYLRSKQPLGGADHG